jgi:hypothetical protein
MAKSNAVKPVGRIVFVLGTLLVTGTAFALEFLGDELLHLTLLPRYSYALQRVIFFGIFGLYLMAVIDGRLLDAGLPRWYRYPAFAVWLWSISLPVIWPREWLIGVALFALLLIVGYSIPGKPVQVMPASVGESAEPEEKAFAPIKMYRARWLVNPVGFLHSLLTIACLWLPLICLEDASGQGAGVWIARFGYSILSIVWFFNVLGRLDDAGRLPRERYGYIATGFVLLISMLRQWHWFSFSNAAHIASMLLPWLKLINGYEKLALFLLIQVPLALLPSKPRPDEPAPLQKVENKYAKGLGKRRKVAKPYPVGPFEYLCIQLVFACLCLPLIYIDDVSGGSVGSWIARLGYAILGFFWFGFSIGRFEDAGWGNSWSPAQYCLVVFDASLMPLAFHWVNGYEALAIFVLIQTPTALLRSKPRPEEPMEETEEDEKCLRDPLGGILVRNKDQVDIAYTEPKPPVFTGISSGRSKRTPSWRRY